MDAKVCSCSLNIVIVPDPNQDQILPAGLAADNNLLTGIVEYFNAASESSRFVRGSLILILRCPIAPLVAFGVFASEKVGNPISPHRLHKGHIHLSPRTYGVFGASGDRKRAWREIS